LDYARSLEGRAPERLLRQPSQDDWQPHLIAFPSDEANIWFLSA
jgi:hypothetical protein